MEYDEEPAFIQCLECNGTGEIDWQVSGLFGDPDSAIYKLIECEACYGTGEVGNI